MDYYWSVDRCLRRTVIIEIYITVKIVRLHPNLIERIEFMTLGGFLVQLDR